MTLPQQKEFLKTLTKPKVPSPAIAPTEEEKMASSYRTKILLIAEGMSNDSTTRSEICPKCGGGSSREKAFSVSKDPQGFVYWHCFRASCGYKGSTGGGTLGERTAQRSINPLTAATVALTQDQEDYFEDEYGLSAGRAGVKFCPDLDGFVFPVTTYSGLRLGCVVRWYDGRTPKSRNYVEVATHPFNSYYKPIKSVVESTTLPMVVVEDQLSAQKFIHWGVRSVALLGTNINWETAYDLAAASPYIALALDRHTMPLALGYKKKFELLFQQIDIWQLDKDLKYVTNERIGKALSHPEFRDFITHR